MFHMNNIRVRPNSAAQHRIISISQLSVSRQDTGVRQHTSCLQLMIEFVVDEHATFINQYMVKESQGMPVRSSLI